MENKYIAKKLQLLAQLMELHQINPFKIKSVAAAAFKVDKLGVNLASQNIAELENIEGIGKSIAQKIAEIIQTQELAELHDLLKITPEGIVEMLQIKGIGPKKITTIWHDLEIESVGELYYACNENRLLEAKGFGVKTQEEIKKAIEFKIAANGKFLYARVEHLAERILASLQKQFPQQEILITGEYRRRCEIIHQLDFLIDDMNSKADFECENISFHLENEIFKGVSEDGLHIQIKRCDAKYFAKNLLIATGNAAHIEQLAALNPDLKGNTEAEIYENAGLEFIEPELREGGNEIALAKAKKIPKLITYSDLKGSLHNHSTWSDGVNTLEEMALYCKNDLKLEYLGICDHSKSAFYANGLQEVRVLAQHQEIDILNEKLAPFKIFKGIESDILNDGNLDYSDEILAKFDFVVASVHSNLKMEEEKATQRLLKAIENPYTTILGHPTGRLLLSRKGYPIDYEKIIDACAANGVVIEINANPLRLDLDWRWHAYAIEKGVLLSINPDAHRTSGFLDMKYGTLIARKGGLSAENCLNSLTLSQITEFFNHKKSKI